MHKPNMLLESDVEEELSWDPQLDNSRIGVSAKDGRVTLTGSVPTYYELVRAGDDVRLVGGVKSVDNQLLVGLLGDAITDETIAVACADALNGDRFVPKGSVTVDVLGGYVTLNGQVRHHFQCQAAEHAVQKIDGVLGIDDKITISSDPAPGDVADRINKAFRRNSIIDDSMITVSNVGSTIYLDGTADSWTAREEAEDTAWAAPGVGEVVDRVEVV
jgi:osmotically-inducible protein OsmY